MKIFSIICSLFILVSCASDDNLINYQVDNVFDGGFQQSIQLSSKLKEVTNGWEFNISESRINPKIISYGYFSFQDNDKLGFALSNEEEYRTFDDENSFKITENYHMSKLQFLSKKGADWSKIGQFINETDLIDSVYTYLGSKSDTLVFLGDKKGRVLTMVPTNESSKDIYQSGQWQEMINKFKTFLESPKFFFNLTYDDQEFFFYNDEANKRLVFHYMEGLIEKYTSSSINDIQLYAEKMILNQSIKINGKQIQKFTGCNIGANTITFDNGTIKNQATPIYTNTLGISTLQSRNPQSFDPSPGGGAWTSFYGWSKRNQLDILKMKVFKSDLLQIYLYNLEINAQGMYHRVGYMYITPSNSWATYGGDKPAFHTAIVGNTIKYNTATWSWTGNTPAAVAQMQSANIGYMTRPNGFIVLRTIGNKPILVFADDAETWVIYDNR